MIKKKMQKALNEQIKYELESAYLYLSMAAYFHSIGRNGMARWMRVQTQEEMLHALKFFEHIKSRGRIKLLPLSQPKMEWSSPLDAFQHAYRHEQSVSARINELAKLARKENDRRASALLKWFIAEQVEEEESASAVVQRLEQVGSSRAGLSRLDRELGERTFTMPTQD